jgi:DNA-binding transcriptional ArsR family regulator
MASPPPPRLELHELCACLADKARLRILLRLAQGEQSVEVMRQELDMVEAALSYHLTHLLRAGLVYRRKVGKRAFYSIADEDAHLGAGELLRIAASDRRVTISTREPAPLQDSLREDRNDAARVRGPAREERHMTRAQCVAHLLDAMKALPGCAKLVVAWRTNLPALPELADPVGSTDLRTFPPDGVPDDLAVPEDAVVTAACTGAISPAEGEMLRDAVDAIVRDARDVDAAVRLNKLDGADRLTYHVDCKLR